MLRFMHSCRTVCNTYKDAEHSAYIFLHRHRVGCFASRCIFKHLSSKVVSLQASAV